MEKIKKIEKTKFEDRMDQILDIAKKNNYVISYRVIADTLKDKNKAATIEDIQKAVDLIENEGIDITMSEMDEGYDESYADYKEFIPADVNILPRNINVEAIV